MSGRRKRGASLYVFVAVIWMACLGLMATDVSGAGEDPNVLQGNLAESFRIALDSIEFSARTSLLSENGEMVCALPERRLTFSLRYERCGSDMPIGVDTNPPTILRVFDETGHAVDCRSESADGSVESCQVAPWPKTMTACSHCSRYTESSGCVLP